MAGNGSILAKRVPSLMPTEHHACAVPGPLVMFGGTVVSTGLTLTALQGAGRRHGHAADTLVAELVATGSTIAAAQDVVAVAFD